MTKCRAAKPLNRRNVASGCILRLTLALLAAGCAVTDSSPRESMGGIVHSLSVSNTIQLRYQADRVLAPLGLAVETYRQEVFISGLAQNDVQRARAVAIARDTPGVVDAYFVDMDLPGRPVSRRHYHADSRDVWVAAVAAVRASGYQIEKQEAERSLVTAWRPVIRNWSTMWVPTQERLRLALYPHGEVITVIAVADRLDTGGLSWPLQREKTILQNIQEALTGSPTSRS